MRPLHTYFDKPDGDGFILGEAHKIDHIVCVVEPFDDHNVDLDALHTERKGSLYTVQDSFVTSSSSHELKLERIERVERDVEMCESVVHKRVQLASAESDAVGSDTDLFEAVLLERIE